MSLDKVFSTLKGGAGSGFFGHAGRAGLNKRGGSLPRGGISGMKTTKNGKPLLVGQRVEVYQGSDPWRGVIADNTSRESSVAVNPDYAPSSGPTWMWVAPVNITHEEDVKPWKPKLRPKK